MTSTVSRQTRWETVNREAGLCACGRPPLVIRIPHKASRKYAQCRQCLAKQRKRTGYKGGRTKYGAGSPPGPRTAVKRAK